MSTDNRIFYEEMKFISERNNYNGFMFNVISPAASKGMSLPSGTLYA